MVGYKESPYSYNDPADEWEKAMIAGGKSGGRRVLAGGYAELARDAATSVKGTMEIVARFLNPFRGLPSGKGSPKKNENDDYGVPPSRGKPKAKPKGK